MCLIIDCCHLSKRLSHTAKEGVVFNRYNHQENVMELSSVLQTFKDNMNLREGSNDKLGLDVFTGLLTRYFDRVPDAKKIFELLHERGDKVVNDHVAFRSFEVSSLLKIFLHLGYSVQFDQAGEMPMNFEAKKLTAVWLKHSNPDFPRVFVSECRLKELSAETQSVMARYIASVEDPITELDFSSAKDIDNYLHSRLWETPSYEDFQTVSDESEYLSWVLFNDYYLNHFTVTVNDLLSFNFDNELKDFVLKYRDLYLSSDEALKPALLTECKLELKSLYQTHMEYFVSFLMDNDFSLNAPNDKVLNISPDGLLLQCSTKAAMVEAQFSYQMASIPGSYVEFAYRGLQEDSVEKLLKGELAFDALEKDHRRDGFEVANADKIFESTFTRDFNDRNVESHRSGGSEHLRITKKLKELCLNFQ